MKNSIGSSIGISLFGESHGAGIGCVLDGIPSGIKINTEYINHYLELRKGEPDISTKRREKDGVRILSGVYNGFSTGTPISAVIENSDIDSSSYEKSLPRPSHADLTAEYKYHGYQDPRGGGHFSGRITAPVVIAGAICKDMLKGIGVNIFAHIKSIKDISDRSFSICPEEDYKAVSNEFFPVFSSEKEREMKNAIICAKESGDSLGGIIECAVTGVPGGVGEPWFDTIEGEIAKMMFSVPAVKGIEFGKGFDITKIPGSEANDPIIVKDGKIVTESNNNGGILGGITNGMPIVFSVAVKPTPSISKTQKTVNLSTMESVSINQGGRHDPCIVPRAVSVIECSAAIVLSDILAKRFGTDFLAGVK